MSNSEPTKSAECLVVEAAQRWIGTPYRHHASIKDVGCDCLGLVRGVWRQVEGAEPQKTPAYSSTWSQISGRERLIELGNRYFICVRIADRRAGDMLVFRMRRNSVAKHVGIQSGPTSFIHAYSGAQVAETSLCDFWRRRICAVFRFPSVASAQIAALTPDQKADL